MFGWGKVEGSALSWGGGQIECCTNGHTLTELKSQYPEENYADIKMISRQAQSDINVIM